MINNILKKFRTNASEYKIYTIRMVIFIFFITYMSTCLHITLVIRNSAINLKTLVSSNKPISKQSLEELNSNIKFRNKICWFLSPLDEIKEKY